MNLRCISGCESENTSHFFLHCPNFVAKRNTLLNRDTNIDVAILDFKPAITCSKLTIKH